MLENTPLIELAGVNVSLGHGARASHILKDVSLSVARGTTVGLVGESGSGKSTIAKTVVGIHRPSSGRITFDGVDLTSPGVSKKVRRRIQLVPQDPYSSLDPRRTIAQTLAEAIDPVAARVGPHRRRILEALEMVSLDASTADRYPHEFSGGQRQRIAIARALAVGPELVIADEITSALDVSTQAEILALLNRLRRDLSLTMVFISHNLAVVRALCDEVVVLLHGEVVEHGQVIDVFRRPQSDYTRRLLESVPGGPAFRLVG
ncbi:ABC transporter ATP-binding protein [Arthrobacter sp. ZGTC412]|uniref:ABC transporter ATP-binding protein n=1 Tax=Arthrobacter sp. ZGTC412 TaxID=2058900 RepID=UPI000CE31F4E|nr:ABC transporter ATP-binding protein [Arthrobacter sp. ZGTC412]